jgi:predicted TIM-barrel fold metal-dependent hydrolase
MINGFRVVDADAHMQEPADLWDKYVEPAFYDRRPIVKETMHRIYYLYEPSELFPAEGLPNSVWKWRPDRMYERMPEKYNQAYDAWWSPESRLVDMERYGWDKMVCIPGIGAAPLGQQGRDPDLMWALARAYHNWAHDFCSADPTKLKLVANLPTYDIENTVTETRRAVAELGAVTVMMPKPQSGKFWHEPEYDPFWELIEELDVPLSFHGVGSCAPHAGSRYSGQVGAMFALQHAIGFPMENMISLGHIIYTGILDKHPNLRCSFLEGNAGWVPFWLGRLDDHAVGRQSVFWDDNNLTMTPTEYFKRNIWVACDGDEVGLGAVLDLIGDDNFVWNTDYPHSDAPDPDKALPELLEQPISEESKRKILWDNPVRLFGERITG